MKNHLLGRKGSDNFSLLLTVFAMIALTVILIGVTVKYSNLTKTIPGVGSNALVVLSSYDRADAALLYVDSAARLSLSKAAFELGQNGFYGPGANSECGAANGYMLWSLGRASKQPDGSACTAQLKNECIPASHLELHNYFGQEIARLFSLYNEKSDVKLPGKYRINIKSVEKGTEVEGIAEKPIIVSGRAIEYSVKPSFRESVNIDVINDFQDIISNAAAVVTEDALAGIRQDSLKSKLDSFSAQNPKLKWQLDGFEENCNEKCNLERDCSLCRRECETVTEVECDEGDQNCREVQKEECEEICDIPGREVHSYCSYTGRISATPVDERYKSDGNKDSSVLFASEAGPQPNSYRFAINWVEIKDVQCCSSSQCSTNYR